MRTVIIGSGNLAEALAVALAASDAELVQLFARNAERGREVAARAATVWCDDPAQLAEADIYLIAVSDRAVGEVAASLRFPERAIVAHTAGSVALDVLPATCRRAVFYPMQTFTRGRRVDFGEIPIFLEAEDAAARESLEALARSLSRQVLWASSEQRRSVHLAAVFACNFANHMYALSDAIVSRAGLSIEVMKPLIRETAAKAVEAAHPASVQTGPAVRGDAATQERHRALLAADPEIERIYTLISSHIWETSKKI